MKKVARKNASDVVGRVSGGTQKGRSTGKVGARIAKAGGKKTAQRKATRRKPTTRRASDA